MAGGLCKPPLNGADVRATSTVMLIHKGQGQFRLLSNTKSCKHHVMLDVDSYRRLEDTAEAGMGDGRFRRRILGLRLAVCLALFLFGR
jgi:hypothetical protein